MSVAAGSPVLWVNVKSLLGTGPYAGQNMRLWNEALVEACRAYPNLRVYDWAAVVRNEWFASDVDPLQHSRVHRAQQPHRACAR